MGTRHIVTYYPNLSFGEEIIHTTLILYNIAITFYLHIFYKSYTIQCFISIYKQKQ